MQIKNKLILLSLFILNLFVFNSNIHAEEFNISAEEISIDKENDIVTGKGSIEVTDSDGKLIKADKVKYEKSKKLILAEGSVEFFDAEGNILKTNKITYDKIKNLIVTYNNSEVILKEGYKIKAKKILYNNAEKIISSSDNSVLTDLDGNLVSVDMFQYHLESNLFSSIGNIKIVDANKNKYFFKEMHIDTKKKEMVGSEVSVVLDQDSFGVKKENDPRFVANDIIIAENKIKLSKGIFTVCKKNGTKCPPWSFQAKKIEHDKIKKTIYYENATLKVYGIPVFYFPRFYHPDPTVSRQSGLLIPSISDSTTLGAGFGLPYFWAISKDRDITFTPKFYVNENILLLNEYRQAFKNGFLTLDTSYTQGYKTTSATKTGGSRNHIFAQMDYDLSKNDSYESNVSLKVQKTSNDTYLKIHNINTALVDKDNTNLENIISYNFNKDDAFFNISAAMYEDLTKETNSRYEYILPNILFGKSFFTETFGTLDFKSETVYKNYETNKHTSIITNNIIWRPMRKITPKGFVNTIEGIIKNINYKARNTDDYKNNDIVNEMNSVISFKSSLPLKKENNKFSNIFSPNFMIRFAPGHMRNLSDEDISLKYANLYNVNKTSQIEEGISAVFGFDFTKNKKNEKGEEEKQLSLSLGQIFHLNENKDIPSKSSLDQKSSDLVGEINYNFSEIGQIDYKFSVDHNLSDINYSEISTNFNFSKIGFNLDYLEEQNHVGNEHYVNAGITLSLNNSNKFSFETKKNFKTESTELYNMSYEYMNDCLTAGIIFRREFYEDDNNDIEPKDSLMFKITFIPFGSINTPAVNP